MTTPKSKIVRNPSAEEIKKNIEAKAVKATQIEDESELVTSQISSKETNKKSDFKKYKPQKSVFENKGFKFRLPSGNTTIPKEYLDDDEYIIVKPMTTSEEDMILNIVYNIIRSSERDLSDSIAIEIIRTFFNIMDKIIDRCLKTNISVYEISILDKLLLFVFILAISYGEDHEFEIDCPYCGHKQKVSIKIFSDIAKTYYNDDPIDYPFIQKLNDIEGEIYVTYIFPKIGNKILEQSEKEFKDSLGELIIDITGVDANGEEIKYSKEKVKELIQFISPNDRKLIQDRMKEFGTKYGTDFNIPDKFICIQSECGSAGKSQSINLPLEQMFIKIVNNLIE